MTSRTPTGKTSLRIALALLLNLVLVIACAQPSPTATATLAAAPTATETSALRETASVPTATSLPEASSTPVPTETSTVFPTPEATVTPTETPAVAELPSWAPTVSNTEARLSADGQMVEYYGVDGQYIVSCRNTANGYEFYNYSDDVSPEKQPELFVGAGWDQIKQRMDETGAVKVLPCSMKAVERLEVWRKDGTPYALKIYLKEGTVFYWPFDKQGQASPASDLRSIGIFDINPDLRQPIEIWADEGVEENFVGTGRQASLGQPLAKFSQGLVAFTGHDYPNPYNMMDLATFVGDIHGRKVYPD
jgi:hypothetical protein